jgi:osmotically-inducible protein OsmY
MTKTQDIRDAVELEVSYDPLVDMSDITVKNLNGEVALNGTVPSFPQYLEAAAAARRVSGVKNVHNHLEVVLPTGDYRDDPTLTTAANNALTLNPVDVTVYVQDALDRYALIRDDSDVTVDTDGNTVTLSGHVRTWAEHDAVVAAAWMPVGVYFVSDDLYVTG